VPAKGPVPFCWTRVGIRIASERDMPRKPRFAPPGVCTHVVNRGNDKRRIFLKDADYDLFIDLMISAKRRAAVSVFAVCPMPTHFHAVVRPEEEGALSTYMQWLTSYYAIDFRTRTDTRGHGHVFQRRFWNDLARNEQHLLIQLRYVEANPIRANLVKEPESWPWSSYSLRSGRGKLLLDPLPVPLPKNWRELLLTPQPYDELDPMRHPKRRGRPPDSECE
jgi:putative transposase